jgi:hypothetical protein
LKQQLKKKCKSKMTKAAAFRATYSDWKLIRTRSCVQIVFEIPLEQSGSAYDALGGMPNPAAEVWCGIARLALPIENIGNDVDVGEAISSSHPGQASPSLSPDKPVTERSLAQRAGALCTKPAFWQFLNETSECIPRGCRISNKDEAKLVVRTECDVKSRADIIPGTPAGDKFEQLDSRFKLWNYGPQYVEGAA